MYTSQVWVCVVVDECVYMDISMPIRLTMRVSVLVCARGMLVCTHVSMHVHVCTCVCEYAHVCVCVWLICSVKPDAEARREFDNIKGEAQSPEP